MKKYLMLVSCLLGALCASESPVKSYAALCRQVEVLTYDDLGADQDLRGFKMLFDTGLLALRETGDVNIITGVAVQDFQALAYNFRFAPAKIVPDILSDLTGRDGIFRRKNGKYFTPLTETDIDEIIALMQQPCGQALVASEQLLLQSLRVQKKIHQEKQAKIDEQVQAVKDREKAAVEEKIRKLREQMKSLGE